MSASQPRRRVTEFHRHRRAMLRPPFSAVAVRTGRDFCMLETGCGSVAYLFRDEAGGQGFLPLPGQKVRVDELVWVPEHDRYRVKRASYDPPAHDAYRRAIEAEGLLRTALVTLGEQDALTARRKLERAISLGKAPALAYLQLADLALGDSLKDQAAELLLDAGRHFRGARRTEVQLVMRLAATGRVSDAEEAGFRLAEESKAPVETALLREIIRLALLRALDDPTYETRSALLRAHAILGRARQEHVTIEDPPRAALLDVLAGQVGWETLRVLRTAGFKVLPAPPSHPAWFVIEPEDQLAHELQAWLLEGRRTLVRPAEQPIPWQELAALRTEVDRYRTLSSGTNPSTSYAWVVHHGAMEIKEQYRRGLADGGATLVPFDPREAIQMDGAHVSAMVRERLSQFVGRRDLFAVQVPVLGDNFFGREGEFQRFAQLVEDGHHVGVFGLRKMGKTSFLKQLDRVRTADLVVYVDLQQTLLGEMPQLWWALARELRATLERRHPHLVSEVNFKLGSRERFDADPRPERNGTRFHEDVTRVLDTLDHLGDGVPHRIVLAIDEVEYLTPGTGAIQDGMEFFRWARGVAQQTNGRVLTTIGGADPRIAEAPRFGDRDNPVFRFYQQLYMPPLESGDCRDMISSLGRRMGMDFSSGAIVRIFAETSGHPFLTRRLCSFILHRESFPTHVDETMVERAVDLFISEESDAFDDIIQRLRDQFPEEWEVLTWLSEAPLAPMEIAELTGRPVEATLRHLTGYQLIELREGRYHVRSGLLHRFLERRLRRRG